MRRFKPKLAVCVYHNLRDFFEIPEYLDLLSVGYRFFLRHHTIHGSETVLYAAAATRHEKSSLSLGLPRRQARSPTRQDRRVPSPRDSIIVIPTYWSWGAGGGVTTASYDHPTPLDGESTLPPLIEDLCSQRTHGFRVLVLVGLAHPDLAAAASEHVRGMLHPFRERLDLRICDAASVQGLRAALGPDEAHADLFHPGSYAGIRNLQLLVPHILGAEVVIVLDDDERVEPGYVDRALKYAGSARDGERILGLAGPYLQPKGGVYLNEQPPTGNAFRDKARHINAAMRMLTEHGGGLAPSPMALGGNMVFHRDLFTHVCFDPEITRGEDIDYLINARLEGIRWWFDPALTILHLPPRHLETPAYQRTHEDALRFIYEREKLGLHGEVRPAWLDPYPGALLGDDLEAHALAALEADAAPELVERLGDPRTIVEEARQHAARSAPRYAAHLSAWRELMTRVEADEDTCREARGVFPRL